MSRDLVLTADAVALLLELLEQDDAIISAGAADMRAGAVVVLENAGFLTPHEEVLAVTDMTDHEDVPVALTWSHEKGALTYFSPSGAMVTIPKERVQTRSVEFGLVLKAIAGDWDVPDRRPPFALAGDFLWKFLTRASVDVRACRFGSLAGYGAEIQGSR